MSHRRVQVDASTRRRVGRRAVVVVLVFPTLHPLKLYSLITNNYYCTLTTTIYLCYFLRGSVPVRFGFEPGSNWFAESTDQLNLEPNRRRT